MEYDPKYDPYSPHHSVKHRSTRHAIGGGVFLSSLDVWRAAIAANKIWVEIEKIEIAKDLKKSYQRATCDTCGQDLPEEKIEVSADSLLEILDQKVISGLVGEFFRAELAKNCDYLFSNPRDDGHPDLCAVSDRATEFLSENGITLPNIKTNLSKAIWTPYGGEANRLPGVEVKATIVGDPVKEKRGSRYPNAKRPSWSAHHQQTPVLLGLVWDYVDGLPKIIAAFFANSLDTSHGKQNQHWSSVSIPKDGSKGTSSCSLLREGCNLMYENQVLEPSNEYINHKLRLATRTIRALSLLTKKELRDIIDEHEYQIPTSLKKQEMIKRFLRLRYDSLMAAIQASDDQFDYAETIAGLLEQIGQADFAPTDNHARNWLKLRHYFTYGTSSLEKLRTEVLWRLGPNPTNLLRYLYESINPDLIEDN